ncbi:STAS domain-containing protein [Gandjariella thermophila]|uniref:Anti-sigma factor antagonist n=1 Tax=Gandjariella thermophila TaxID=1931992 RepID=A0A4D4J6Q2_9PSEU|nr:STAS domain-containing protein [Gandjariella thermophila]GDY32281.1 hypothetical protein GTS_39140 [Gandjariella thermophila]
MGSALHIRNDSPDHALVVRVSGEVDMTTAAQLERQLEQACAQAGPEAAVVVDLLDVSFLDAAGLGAMVRVQQRCHQHGHRLRVVASHRPVLRPLTLTGLDAVLEVVPSLADALHPEAD